MGSDMQEILEGNHLGRVEGRAQEQQGQPAEHTAKSNACGRDGEGRRTGRKSPRPLLSSKRVLTRWMGSPLAKKATQESCDQQKQACTNVAPPCSITGWEQPWGAWPQCMHSGDPEDRRWDCQSAIRSSVKAAHSQESYRFLSEHAQQTRITHQCSHHQEDH